MKKCILIFSILMTTSIALCETEHLTSGKDSLPSKPNNVTCAAEALQLLDYYRAMDLQALAQMKSDLDFVFEEYAKSVPAFVDDVNDLGSKLKFCWKKVRPGGESSKAYVRRLWRHHIFTPGKLKSDLQLVVARFQARINDNRSLLLIDLEDMPFFDEDFASETGFDEFQEKSTAEFNLHCNQLVAQNVSAEIITEVVTEIVAAAVFNGSALVGAGALGSVKTLGLSLAVAVAADMAVSGYMERRMDRKLTGMLQNIGNAIWDGDPKTAGMKKLMIEALEDEWLTRRKLAAKALKKQNDRLINQEVR